MTSGPDTQMGEREAFEEWFSIEKKHFCDGYGRSVIFNKCDNGAYACGLVDDVWEAWQARADQPMPGGDVVRARNMAYQLLQLRYGEKDHSAIVLLVDKIIEAYTQASPAPATEGTYKPTYVTTSTNPQVGDTEAQAFIEKRQRTGPGTEQPDDCRAAFERQWVLDWGMAPEKGADGKYLAVRGEGDWDLWQSAWREAWSDGYNRGLEVEPTKREIVDVASQEMDTLEWLKSNHPEVFTEQKHLDAGTPERAYWHYGRWSALKDIRRRGSDE